MAQQKINPKQLSKARIARGLTMADLAKEIGVSRQSISKYEMGTSEPRGENLVSLITVLDFPLTYFSKESKERASGAAFFRSQAASTNKLRNMQEMRIEYVSDIVSTLSEYVNLPQLNLPETMNKDIHDISEEDIKNCAENLRKFWNLGNSPIGNLINILESNGVIVSETNMSSEKLDAVSQWVEGRPYILLTDNEESAVRRRFNLAHELGHILLHGSVESVFEIPSKEYKKVLEYQANLFASHFLLPDDSFSESLLSTSLDFFIELKKYWKVSIQAEIFKTYHGLQLMTEDQYLYLNKKIAWKKWKKKEPLDDDIPIEKPSLLNRAFTMLVEEHVFQRQDLIQMFCLPNDEIEKILSIKIDRINAKKPMLRLVKDQKHG